MRYLENRPVLCVPRVVDFVVPCAHAPQSTQMYGARSQILHTVCDHVSQGPTCDAQSGAAACPRGTGWLPGTRALRLLCPVQQGVTLRKAQNNTGEGTSIGRARGAPAAACRDAQITYWTGWHTPAKPPRPPRPTTRSRAAPREPAASGSAGATHAGRC